MNLSRWTIHHAIIFSGKVKNKFAKQISCHLTFHALILSSHSHAAHNQILKKTIWKNRKRLMPWPRHLSHAFANERRFCSILAYKIWTIFMFECECFKRLNTMSQTVISPRAHNTTHTQKSQSVAGVYSSAHNNDNRSICHSTIHVDTGLWDKGACFSCYC